ncbi:FtsX-like permease family protein [uncultured Sunxiuqinia sp.]|uniref:ABC transporter permease n=1 Tax=uncultured Sunxiuqinia sp. TaxID=1573825 RepID=UPI0026327109|nr:FtsX-like permease family protein [uncultured Sunxiuqinia sp.]
MITSVAWRNIWRNPVRSGIIITAISIGMFAGVFSATFTKGWMNQRLEAGVETETSHIQLHEPTYRENYEINQFIRQGVQLADQLSALPEVDGVSPRVTIQSMIASAETGTGVKIMGIIPEKEKQVTKLSQFVTEGDYFESISRNPIIIGKKLAEKLKIKLKSKVVITLQDADGNITGGAFRVCGIFDLTNSMFEEANVFVRYNDLARLGMLPEGVAHEIIVHLNDQKKLESVTQELRAKYPELEVMNWKELTPELGYLNEIGNLYTYIFVIIILLSLGFGIINTMLMVVMERVKELGMLMAIGMGRLRVFLMLMLETTLLTLTGGLIGIVLGLGASFALQEKGINLSNWAQGLEDFGYSAIIYPVVETQMVLVIILLVILTGIIASVYPARKALKYNPAEAIRTE